MKKIDRALIAILLIDIIRVMLGIYLFLLGIILSIKFHALYLTYAGSGIVLTFFMIKELKRTLNDIKIEREREAGENG